MGSEDDLEFELDDEEQQERSRKGSSRSKDSPEKNGSKKKHTNEPQVTKEAKKGQTKKKDLEKKAPKEVEKTTKKAKKMPLADGIKRRLAHNKREIERLRKEIMEVKDDKEALESELESLESDFEKIKNKKESLEEDINHKAAVANALEKKQNRTQKDFENFKKRTDIEIERKAKMSQKKLLLGVIESLDNMDRALAEAEKGTMSNEARAFLTGLGSVKKSMLKTLSDQGVEPIDPLNMQFDPHLHDAVDTRMDSTVNENTVIIVDSKGYIMGEMVLRPAKVKVSIGGKPWPKVEKRTEEDEDPSIIKDDHPVTTKERKPSKKQRKEEPEELDEVDEDELDELMEEIDDLTRKKKDD
ncbi:MAG: nucleotide exchange factor GrpE [Candidatus Thermoplasmatota archaeon]|jgi:molecular chaperone GrpE|nr:nucleotide exchange factor GrpE [Candidatus Thermoplasmatota archaeon]